ncbi:hypothetical protein MRB53_018561 [Persea americana]|uniref:Uncharacterized protein n=1 Tax=Persea americana TaxID=3435 RepID=A0ACC2M9N4_PERAE|nr:hypothetical protein MRB53_018561 [Persea americana]
MVIAPPSYLSSSSQTTNMATSRSTMVFTVLLVLLLIELDIYSGGTWADEGHGVTIDCPSKCDYRCSKASRQKMCIRACNTCCQRCNCVPPGTSGNRDVCPCYANMTTHGGRKKCP